MKLKKNTKYYLSQANFIPDGEFLVSTEKQHNNFMKDTDIEETIYEVTVTKIIRVKVKDVKQVEIIES